jgi:hypothetical protein
MRPGPANGPRRPEVAPAADGRRPHARQGQWHGMSATNGDDTLVGHNRLPDTIDGLGGNDWLIGLGRNDSLIGGAGDDTLAGGNGDDTLDGGEGNDSLVGGIGSDLLLGGEGADTIFAVSTGNPASDTLNGGAGDDYIFVGNNTSEVITGGGFDVVDLAGYTDGVGGWSQIGTTWTDGVITVQTAGSDVLFTDDGENFFEDPNSVCFAAGTRILTARGQIPVERLRPGDLVATLSGRGAPFAPVLWIGRRRVALAGHPFGANLAPVRIRAGALADGVPRRDLLVSPDHCLYLDGALVPARLLVNGRSVTVEHALPEVTYLHIELVTHDVVLAEGAPAETWLDAGNRAWFENASVALLRVDSTLEAYATRAAEPCAPVVQAGPRLRAIRDAIALRALAAAGGRMPASAA